MALRKAGICSPASWAARVPGTAGWAGPIQSPLCSRLHSSAGWAVSQRPSTLSSAWAHSGATCSRSARVAPCICSPKIWSSVVRRASSSRTRPPCWPRCALSASWLATAACHCSSSSACRARASSSSAARASSLGCRSSLSPSGPACSSSSLSRASRVLACSSCRPFTSARVWLSRPCNWPSCCCHCCWR
ncbi:hypothetical protein D3C80_1304720 [compost metagenome]